MFKNNLKKIKKINKGTKIFWNKMSLPIISDRENYCIGFITNRLEESKSIYITAVTIDNVIK